MIENVLTRLDGVRPSGKGYSCRCPAHDDKSPSLYVSQDDDRVLMYCFAGCEVKDICHAIGLKVSDLFMDKKKMPPAKRREVEVKYSTREKFENLRRDAFLAMAEFRDDTRAVYDFYKLDVPDEVLPAVQMLPMLDHYLAILATGSKEEIIEMMKGGIVAKWQRLWNLHQKRPNLSTWSMGVST
jgi:hypothetical protein